MLLLIDEIDRADEEFEAFLLEVLSDFQVTVPELGTIQRAQPPYVILTSNRTRELHDALKRRCLYHWIDHPSVAREIQIVELRVPGVPDRLAERGGALRGGAARARPAEAARARRDDRLGARADGARPAGARRRARAGDARLAAQVPRGSPGDPRRGARRASSRARVAEPRTPSSGTSSSSGACCARAASRSGRGASPTRCAGSTRSTSRARRTSTGRCGRRSSRAARTSRRSTAPSTRGSCARRRARGCARRRRAPMRDGERRKGGVPGPGPEIDGGEIEVGAWSGDELLRTRDFAAMTPEEFARARRLIAAASRSIGRGAGRTGCVPTGAARALDVRDARPPLARDRRRPRRPRVPQPRAGAAQARADPRRLRLDGGLRPRAPPLPARRARLRPRRRDVRVRHPADAPDRRARRRATPTRRSRRRRSASSTGRAARASASR